MHFFSFDSKSIKKHNRAQILVVHERKKRIYQLVYFYWHYDSIEIDFYDKIIVSVEKLYSYIDVYFSILSIIYFQQCFIQTFSSGEGGHLFSEVQPYSMWRNNHELLESQRGRLLFPDARWNTDLLIKFESRNNF
jgi:hypothetical protein